MKLSIIIVNYNVAYFAEQCIRSVLAAIRNIDAEVFVVDNNSKDGSTEYLERQFPPTEHPMLHIIAHTRNVGFGRANNNAASHATGDYLLFLNPDTLIAEDTLEEALAFADDHPDMGALGVRMLVDDGRFAPESKRGLPTPWCAFCKMSGLATLFPKSKIFGQYYMGYLPDTEPQKIEVVSGAFMMVRNDRREEWFDKDFFMYGEDIDLSYRLMKDDGKQNYYLPTRIIHYKGESTNKSTLRYAHVFYEAMLIFLRKHFPVYALLFYIPIQFAILLKALLSSLKSLWANIRNYLHPSLMTDNDRFIYIGNHADNVKKIAEIDGIDVDRHEADETTMPEGHLALDYEKYTYVIYDLGAFSRKKVLELMEKTAGKIKLATYDPRNEKIIYHWHNRRG
ncbi:glycosyltransferase family 2 protein [Pseudoprevotella muciniphila]|uniref:Glycosyltransferase family 2 protein n=1 Tax=Pseudoprevotella muciniphila TaxID=2133944 RepID=A0A5P8E5C6_9BACT|nr:glycosyltransferase family 2 protein [Pseudoprevotella muciniphila]QFQ12126.1 glycosyltransferase family 2 protein [Pseudoprevotella muciniphila]